MAVMKLLACPLPVCTVSVSKFPKTVRYIQAMRDLPCIKKVSPTAENFAKFVASFFGDQKPLGHSTASKDTIYAGPAKA